MDEPNPYTPPVNPDLVASRAEPVNTSSAPAVVSGLCFLAVAVTSPANLILGLFCWGLLARIFGPYFADNSGGMLLLLLAVAQVSLFAALWLPASRLTRRLSTGLRCVVVVALTILYLGFWLGWTFMLYAEMARTGNWL